MTKLTWPTTPAATTVCFNVGAGVGNTHAGDAQTAVLAVATYFGWKNPDGTPYVPGFGDYMYPGLDNSVWRLKCYTALGARSKVRVWAGALWPQGKQVTVNGVTRPAVWQDVVAGLLDANIVAFATMCVAQGEGESILKLGWEADGNWFAWGIPVIGNAAFVSVWKHVVKVCRTVPGWDMTLEWCVAVRNLKVDPLSCFPSGVDANGKRWVDVVSLDCYDGGAWGGQYSPSDHAAVWTNEIQPMLDAQWAFAQSVDGGRPMAITELGVQSRYQDTANGTLMPPPGHGGGDDPSFVTNMASWVQVHPQAYVSWFLSADLTSSGAVVNTSRFIQYDETSHSWSYNPVFQQVAMMFGKAWNPAAVQPITVASLQAQVVLLQAQLSSAHTQLTADDQQIASLTATVTALQSQNAALQSQNLALGGKVAAARAALA